MSEAKKKASVWPWIAALLIGLAALYVASIGPVFLLLIVLDRPEWFTHYRAADPVDWALERFDEPRAWYYGEYLGWWAHLAYGQRGRRR